MEWEKIFANHLSDKGLVLRIPKELNNNNKNLIKKWEKLETNNTVNQLYSNRKIKIKEKAKLKLYIIKQLPIPSSPHPLATTVLLSISINLATLCTSCK